MSDQRDGLDYLRHRLTDNIRHVYAGRGRNVNVQLSTKKRLEIVLQSDENKRRLFELLSKIELRGHARRDYESKYMTDRPLLHLGSLLAKLSAYAPRTNQKTAVFHDQDARSSIARKSKITYADSISSSRCADAVLQAILGLEVIKQELRRSHWLTVIDNKDCLFKSIVDVCLQRTRECIPLKTDNIKRHVIKRSSSSNPLNSQDEDAHVFLEELLNQSRQDIRSRITNEYPFVGKFECDIDHRLVCTTCGEERTHTEQNQILSLDLQERSRGSKRKAATIQSLLPRFFSTQEISFYCDACDGERAIAHRTVSRLPKVLVLHLKRFQKDERNHSWINDEPITLEDTLSLDQYCQAEALEAARRHDEGLENISATPSDGFPSSDGSRYSSNSPSRSYHTRASTLSSHLSPSSDPSDLAFDGCYDHYPTDYVSDSGGEDSLSRLQPTPVDLAEDSDEELQYRWAIEDSIRVQSLSQSSISNEELNWAGDETLTESIYEDIRALTSNDLSFMSDVREVAPTLSRNSADSSRRSGTSTPTTRSTKMILPELFAMTSNNPTPTHDLLKKPKEEIDTKEERKCGGGLLKVEKDNPKRGSDDKNSNLGGKDDDDDNSDDDDEDLKLAIQASLQPSSPPPISEKEIKEQEDRDLEEAIRRSLLDQEDNKENISPDEFDGHKKSKKDGADDDGEGKKPSKRRSKGAKSMNDGNLSFSQPVGKRDLEPQSSGRRSGSDLKRIQLRRSNTTDVSSMLMSTRTRSGVSSSNSSQIHQHATAASTSYSSSQPFPSSLQRASSGHFEYNLRSLESRVTKGNNATSKSTKSATATPSNGEQSRSLNPVRSGSGKSASSPSAATASKKADSSGQFACNSSSPSRRTSATVSRVRKSDSGSSSASSVPEKKTQKGSNQQQQQPEDSVPDGVAVRPPSDETERAGLYRLRAVVSKPTSGNSTSGGHQAGHYLCDSLGSDGIWRCFDQQTVRRIGSWANMDLQRERIGYLAIYVHTA
ncbi:Ubiquitin carboxyl-terminal hydrolase 29 [Actinomortierella wolfii]|nr:Ubiquitin carboxyl-terminal hydrolase 29 [Actinomortierella wolfii]